MARNRVLVAAAATVVAAATVALGVSTGASAAPSSKYYTVTAPSVVPNGTTSIDVSLGNCGSTSTACPKVSQQYFGSALITIPSGVTLDHVGFTGPAAKIGAWRSTATTGGVLLTNTGTSTSKAIAPGESLDLTLYFSSAPASGSYTFTTDVKQSNDFSGTGNDFLTSAGGSTFRTIGSFTVLIGYPDHLQFIAQPQSIERYVSGSVQDYNQMCAPPSVGVYDSSNHLLSIDGLSITLAPASGSDDPGLHRVGSTTVSASTSSGVATFGTNSSGSCSNGVYADTLGFGFTLAASATWQPNSSTSVSLSTNHDSSAFDVLQYRRPCVGACSVSFSGTHVNWKTNASGTNTDTFTASFGDTEVVPTLSCTSQLQDGTSREGLQVDLADHSKTVTLTFDKFIINNTSNNGTPFWDICFGAPYGFPTLGGYTATPTGAGAIDDRASSYGFYEGVLVNCGTADATQWPNPYPCVVSRKKQAASEIIVISIPNASGDPRMF